MWWDLEGGQGGIKSDAEREPGFLKNGGLSEIILFGAFRAGFVLHGTKTIPHETQPFLRNPGSASHFADMPKMPILFNPDQKSKAPDLENLLVQPAATLRFRGDDP